MTIKPFQKTSLVDCLIISEYGLTKELVLLEPTLLPASPPLPPLLLTAASSALNSTSLKVQGKISRHQSLMQMSCASPLKQLSLLNITQHN